MIRLTKSDAIKAIANHTSLKQADVTAVLNAFASYVTEVTKDGNEVRLPGFGIFRTRNRPERDVRNPSTGETMRSPARSTLVFKAARAQKA